MKYIFTFFALFTVFFCCAQQDDFRTGSVDFSGNKKTKSVYLQRFIAAESGAEYSEETTKQDVRRLKNLSAVANVGVRRDTVGRRIDLTYEITEALTLFPLLSFGTVTGNIWYQIGFTDVNFRGTGNQITAFYRNNDKRHNGAFYYRVPYWGRSKFGTAVSFLRWASIEPTYFPEGEVIYDYAFTSFGASGIYEFAIDHNIEFGANYFVEEYEKLAEQPLQNPPGPDRLTLPKLLFKTNHRLAKLNYHFFYLDGWDNNIILENVYNIRDGGWFHVIKNDFRYFKRVGERGNFGLRARFGLSSNINTPFAPFVLDSQTNIRGAGNRRDRGTGVVLLNTEYRHAFLDPDRGKLKNFAIQGVAFTDIGNWRSPGGNAAEFFQKDEARFFAGGGFRLIYKKAYNAVLRVDYGFDLFRKGERGWVIGAGQYF